MQKYFSTLIVLALTSFLAAANPAVPANALKENEPRTDSIPAAPNGRPDLKKYSFATTQPRPFELTIKLAESQKLTYPSFNISIHRAAARTPLFDYRLDCNLENYLFFPVLDKGAYDIVVKSPNVGAAYALNIKPFVASVTEQDRAAVLKAIDKATANLLTLPPAKSREAGHFTVAVEALVMAALASDRTGGGGKHNDVIEKDYLPWFKSQMSEIPEVKWNNEVVTGFLKNGHPMYCHAIATLALAEMAPHSKEAKALAEKAAKFLLASQLTDRRPAIWRAIKRENPNFGGWRYHANALDADLSVTGWCVIALNACAAADIQPEGMQDALKDAVTFVKCASTREGFSYLLAGSGGTSATRNAIGGLVFALYGEHGPEMDAATTMLDKHLYAGTQCDDALDFPLYYAYYATRLNYLRGGQAWENWRTTAIRQLLKLQRPDGSWPNSRAETQAGLQRYATALSILVLRMSLNEEPAYLTQEIRGF